MNCWRVQNLLAPFLDAVLPAPEHEAVAGHLEACDSCAERAAAVAELPLLEPFRLLPETEAKLFSAFDEALAERIAVSSDGDPVRAVEGPAVNEGPWYQRRIRVSVGVAAGYALLVIGLAGAVVTNRQRMDVLENGLAQRDAVIETLQQRSLLTVREQEDQALSPDWSTLPAGLAPPPVLLPAAVPNSNPYILPASYTASAVPGTTRRGAPTWRGARSIRVVR